MDELPNDIHEASRLEEFATIPQQATVEKMIDLKWWVSHLWDRDLGDVIVWMLARQPGKPDKFVHAYVEASGEMKRYSTRLGDNL